MIQFVKLTSYYNCLKKKGKKKKKLTPYTGLLKQTNCKFWLPKCKVVGKFEIVVNFCCDLSLQRNLYSFSILFLWVKYSFEKN